MLIVLHIRLSLMSYDTGGMSLGGSINNFCIKNIINTNCISIYDWFLLNKKDSQGVISNIYS